MTSELPILNCDACGACCTNMGHPWFWRDAGDPLWDQLPDHLKQEVIRHIDALEDIDLGQPCIWFDLETRKCRHYEHRPQMCRDFEVGSFHCRRMRASQGIDPSMRADPGV